MDKYQYQIDRLQRRIYSLRAQSAVRISPEGLRTVPVLFDTYGSDVIVTFSVDTYTGIKSTATIPTEVAQLDPTAITTFTAGLGRARLNSITGRWVWVGITVKPAGTNISDLVSSLPLGQTFLSRQTVQVPITGGGGTTATVYLPWRV